MLRIGLIGDSDPQIQAHIAIPRALALAAQELSTHVEFEWQATPLLEQGVTQRLSSYQALWVVPGSPYASLEGALQAIRYARERQIPILGSCGGCQHMIIEFARNVLGMHDADHAEINPDAAIQLITPLNCTVSEVTTTFVLSPGSRVAAIYEQNEITEQYGICNYGPNAAFWPALEQGGMHISGTDRDGAPRVIELASHPFFIGTLFQPERSAFLQIAHPLVKALLRAAQTVVPNETAACESLR